MARHSFHALQSMDYTMELGYHLLQVKLRYQEFHFLIRIKQIIINIKQALPHIVKILPLLHILIYNSWQKTNHTLILFQLSSQMISHSFLRFVWQTWRCAQRWSNKKFWDRSSSKLRQNDSHCNELLKKKQMLRGIIKRWTVDLEWFSLAIYEYLYIFPI
jgi:hypothetical protein